MKLLVVEDEALLRHHLQTRLTESGHVVESVANAEEALYQTCLLYTSPSPRDRQKSRMPSSA